MSDAQVLVVGGGPGGASTAWQLARRGMDVLLLDRAHFPRDKPCAEYLSPEASRLLSEMGALEECERAGAATLRGMTVRSPAGERIRGDFAAAHGFRGFRDSGLALRRTILDSILLARAKCAGVRVLEGVRAADVLRDTRGSVRGVSALANGVARDYTARVTVGADGLRSIVGRRLGLTRYARFPYRLALVGHFRGVEGMSEHGEMHVEDDGYVGLANVGDGVTNVALVMPVWRARAAKGRSAAFLDGWLRSRTQLAPRFARAERISPVRATGPFAQRARRAWASGAALVGDAADFYDPFTGEGIYAALRGGELLAPFVERALSARSTREADAALAEYDSARASEFSGKWKVERLVALAVATPTLMNRAARTLSRRKEMADLLVGVAGDFVPPRKVLSLRYLSRLLLSS
ncbi:MAG TPA: FAD-dependent oxidoreductase [Gemmatimonadaceae bacterium]|nr:FAD-dependent oxidoreductase [Gemmatimonadaceae bacterium]